MKLQIHSIQIYDTHKEEIKESYDCEITQLDKMTCISYSKGRFVLKENSVIIENGNNKLLIKKDYKTNLAYQTEQGNIEMIVKGISVEMEWEHSVRNETEGSSVGVATSVQPDDRTVNLQDEKNPPSSSCSLASVRIIYEITIGNNLPYKNDVRLTIIR